MKIDKYLDTGIKPLIIFLNANHINTKFSCTGHTSWTKNRGYIYFKRITDCDKFINLIANIDVKLKWVSDIIEGGSKRILWFTHDEKFTQSQIDNEWYNLFLQIKQITIQIKRREALTNDRRDNTCIRKNCYEYSGSR